MFKSNYFSATELIHPKIIKDIGEVNAYMRLDESVLMDLDYIREEWGGPIYINRLDFGLDSRGLRPPNDTDGSFYSVHKQGKAFDLEPVEGSHEDLFHLIFKLAKEDCLIAINTMESLLYTRSWVHVAKMNHDHKVYIIEP